jgi:hypothetical protein
MLRLECALLSQGGKTDADLLSCVMCAQQRCVQLSDCALNRFGCARPHALLEGHAAAIFSLACLKSCGAYAGMDAGCACLGAELERRNVDFTRLCVIGQSRCAKQSGSQGGEEQKLGHGCLPFVDYQMDVAAGERLDGIDKSRTGECRLIRAENAQLFSELTRLFQK